ncbi:MAG: hypothetical protein ACXWB0_07815 [Sulfuricurvum sp.]
MTKISSDFAPPVRIIAPFFIVGTLFYAFSIIGLLTLNSCISWLDLRWIGVVHAYLIGFVMLTIVGALAQLLPVVLERGHCCIGFYPIIFTFISIGSFLLWLGFWIFPSILSYGGLILLLGFGIFTIELMLTGKKELGRSLSTKIIGFAVLFLTLGSTIGWIMTLGLSGSIAFDPITLIDLHVSTLLAGTVMLILIGIAHILLPMFGLAHGFDETPAKWSIRLIILGISLLFIAKITLLEWIQTAGILAIILAVVAHIVQVIFIARKKARKEFDIWFRSLAVAYVSLVLSMVALVFALGGDERGWILFGWLFGVGFLGFMITGHLYKIIPFLVWFEKFSPLVGKQKVPMLHQMVPKKSANFQWGYSLIGMLLVAISLVVGNDDLWHGGLSFLIVGSLFLIRNIMWMLRFK